MVLTALSSLSKCCENIVSMPRKERLGHWDIAGALVERKLLAFWLRGLKSDGYGVGAMGVVETGRG